MIPNASRPWANAPASSRSPARLPASRIVERNLPEQPSRFYAWQDVAACRGVTAPWFFAPEDERIREKEEREATAKRVCSFCPVRQRCLEHAFAVPEPSGVWGGMTEHERAEELKRRVRERRAGVPS